MADICYINAINAWHLWMRKSGIYFVRNKAFLTFWRWQASIVWRLLVPPSYFCLPGLQKNVSARIPVEWCMIFAWDHYGTWGQCAIDSRKYFMVYTCLCTNVWFILAGKNMCGKLQHCLSMNKYACHNNVSNTLNQQSNGNHWIFSHNTLLVCEIQPSSPWS